MARWLTVLIAGLCILSAACAAPRPAVAGRGSASADDVERQIRLLEEVEWGRAVARKDTAWFERHVANEAAFTTGRTGKVTTKAQEMADILSPTTGGGEDKVQELRVQSYGDAAVATFKLDTRGTDRTGPYHRVARYTEVWISRDGRWQLAASHSSLIPGPIAQ
jgi:ketosteroid isomerase-like protein